MKKTILYQFGQLRDLNRLRMEKVTVEGVASVLAKINRFVGHTPKGPYSVAQHAVLVSALAPPSLAYEALHHDDTEAFIGDLASPIKDHCPEFKALERRVRRRLAKEFGLRRTEPAGVKQYDLEALALEQRLVQGRHDGEKHLTPVSDKVFWPEIQCLLQPIPWEVARDLYVWQHKRLSTSALALGHDTH